MYSAAADDDEFPIGVGGHILLIMRLPESLINTVSQLLVDIFVVCADESGARFILDTCTSA